MATYLKKAHQLNVFDFLAARTLKMEADGYVPWGQHIWWWLDGGWKDMWFYQEGNKRLGYVRVKASWVSICVTNDARRKGVGNVLLDELRLLYNGALRARIHKDNAASRFLFTRNGYKYTSTHDINGWLYLENING